MIQVNIDHLFVDSVRVHSVTPNKFGQLIITKTVTVNCRFREIDRITISGSMENINNQSMVWFPADTIVKIGDLISRDKIKYRITDVIKARRGGETQINFLKCIVEREK